MRRILVGAVAFIAFIMPSRSGSGAPIQWSGNGHFYEGVAVGSPITWEDANAGATAAGGHLATITSQAENAFVFGLVDNIVYWHDYSGPWLGGYQDPATSQANANWRWVTGEAWSYTNWQSGQPNDSGGKAEDKLQFGFAPLTPLWNDILSSDPTAAYRPVAYVVEWEQDPLAPTLEGRWVETGPAIELCWAAASGRFYQVWHCSSLASADWAPLTGNWITGDGTTHCETDTIQFGSPTRFYRLLCASAPPP